MRPRIALAPPGRRGPGYTLRPMPVYLVDKPLGPTSHDVVGTARRTLATRKVGHAGTLDPLASGLLLLLVEDATKLSPFLGGEDKSYLAWVSLGAGTPTLDAEGPVIATGDTAAIDEAAVRNALPGFLDLTEQAPPAYSAVKLGGVKGYEAARRGEELDLAARPAAYRRLDLLAFAATREGIPDRFAPSPEGWQAAEDGRRFDLPPTLGDLPTALIRLDVASGTYVRAFARDLGDALGVPAHLAGLVRTRVGAHDLVDAAPLEALADAPSLPPADALPYPTRRLDSNEAARVRNGQRLPIALPERTAFVDPNGALVAVAETRDGRMDLLRVWA